MNYNRTRKSQLTNPQLTNNYQPDKTVGAWTAYRPLTSKHRAALALIEQFAYEGRKTILFAHNPATLDRLARELKGRGIEHLVFHGNIGLKSRTDAINTHFKNGAVQVLLASYGVASRGLNLPIACRGVFYDRSWTPDVEEQSGCRMLRAAQTQDVEFHYLSLEGSIDDYQSQMIAQKSEAIEACLDYAEQTTQD